MATLTPGVLAKLLNHAGDKDYKVIGEHRTPLLQVIEIVPVLSTDDDPWRSKGFYLKLSDSEHAAYASVADEDVELIRGDKIKLGQFVYVSRLEFARPVPVIRGIRAVPRVRAFVGSPKDLMSSDLLTRRMGTGRKKGLGEVSPNCRSRRELLGSGKRLVVDGDLKMKARSECLGNGRRMSLDSARKVWDIDTPRLANAARSSVSRLKSVKSSETPVARRHSASVVVASSDEKREVPRMSPLARSPVGLDKKPSRPVISPMPNKASGSSPLPSKEKMMVNDVKATVDVASLGRLAKLSLGSLSDGKISWDSLPLNIQELGKGVVSYRDVAICTASRALEEASVMEKLAGCMSMFADLCESSENCSVGSVVESFLELHLTMERTASAIDILLGFNASSNNSIYGVSDHHPPSESSNNFTSKNAKAWIQAAVETDFSRFCLHCKQDKKGTLNNKKSYCVVLAKTPKEAPESRTLPNIRISNGQNGRTEDRITKPSHKHFSAQRKFKTDEVKWPSQNGIKDSATLAHNLIFVSRQWFLKYLETSLKKGFGMQGKDESIQILLGNLRRVNQWLEEQVGSKHETDERVEAVRKKLYNFLLENVDSAARAIK